MLARVSNLPTVWTNVLVGNRVGRRAHHRHGRLCLAIAVSLLYMAGMYLNDAFDARWDAQHRPERPIPAGDVTRARRVRGRASG